VIVAVTIYGSWIFILAAMLLNLALNTNQSINLLQESKVVDDSHLFDAT